MAKTAAQRQADYRKRRAAANQGEGEWRINTWVSSAAHLALLRLAARDGVTMRTMLERLIQGADDATISQLELDTPEWNRYFQRHRTPR